MILAVLDSNVFLQALIGSARSASVRTLTAMDQGKFLVAFSPDTIGELLDVLSIPRMRDRHGMSENQILTFVLSFLPDAIVIGDQPAPSPALPRDVGDAKFLALAAAANADFLVTNDRRHLRRLREFEGTRIVSPAEFLRALN